MGQTRTRTNRQEKFIDLIFPKCYTFGYTVRNCMEFHYTEASIGRQLVVKNSFIAGNIRDD